MAIATQDVANITVLKGGGTFHANMGVITEITSEYCPMPDFAWVVAIEPNMQDNGAAKNKIYKIPNEWNVAEVQAAVWDFLRHYHDGQSLFGTWTDKGRLHIDHVQITSREHAIKTAKLAGEKAIYNLKTKETVILQRVNNCPQCHFPVKRHVNGSCFYCGGPL